jgi:hypothetical protein
MSRTKSSEIEWKRPGCRGMGCIICLSFESNVKVMTRFQLPEMEFACAELEVESTLVSVTVQFDSQGTVAVLTSEIQTCLSIKQENLRATKDVDSTQPGAVPVVRESTTFKWLAYRVSKPKSMLDERPFDQSRRARSANSKTWYSAVGPFSDGTPEFWGTTLAAYYGQVSLLYGAAGALIDLRIRTKSSSGLPPATRNWYCGRCSSTSTS